MNNPNPSAALVSALRSVLRPLVRLMLSSGITYPFIAELLKGLFVSVARKEFRLDNKEPTDSRVSLLTGVHRKDVRRLRETDPDSDVVIPSSISFGAQLVASWVGEPRYLDNEGQPLPLPRGATGSKEASFEGLVASHSTDLRARVVLDEWLRLGIVSLDERGRVVLNTEAFVPAEGLEEKLYFFSHNLHDHAAVATENLLGDREPRLERSVFYDALSPASIDELELQAQQLGTKMLKSLSRSAALLEERDANSLTEPQRFTCGLYFYSEPVDKEPKQ
ncbi:MAG: DUF6502 family protein [Georgfuchsia sp.]